MSNEVRVSSSAVKIWCMTCSGEIAMPGTMLWTAAGVHHIGCAPPTCAPPLPSDHAELIGRALARADLYAEIASEHGGDKAAMYREVEGEFRALAHAISALTAALSRVEGETREACARIADEKAEIAEAGAAVCGRDGSLALDILGMGAAVSASSAREIASAIRALPLQADKDGGEE